MSFKSLEQRYNEKVNSLYAGATNKFADGRASNGTTDEPYLTRKIGDGFWTAVDSRSTPINNTLRDVKRLTLFTISPRGIKFMAKQQLLQTGNTFQQTRLLNPAFVIGNAVPFLHLRRHLRPLSTLFSKTDTSTANVRKLGQLQSETYDSFSSGRLGFFQKLFQPITSTISAVTAPVNVGDYGWEKSRPELGKAADKYFIYKILTDANYSFKYGGYLYQNNSPVSTFSKFIETVNPLGITLDGETVNLPVQRIKYGPRNSNGTYRKYVIDGSTRLTEFGKRDSIENIYNTKKISYIVTDKSGKTVRIESLLADTILELETILFEFDERPLKDVYETKRFSEGKRGDEKGTANKTAYESVTEQTLKYNENRDQWYRDIGGTAKLPFLKYYTGDVESIKDSSATNAKYLAESRQDKSKKISYIKDPSNTIANPFDIAEATGKIPYKFINNTFSDIINVSFAMGNDSPVIFRAYLKDLNESATPTYSENQYIGRNERYITYVGTKRELSFKLSVVAYSATEIDTIWRRINYLTGLVFPYGYNRGIYQPNIVRLTIGNVYNDQPGYITTLDKSFSGVTETWDIDGQVPISAEMSIQFTIIEKGARIAESPFYGITENLEGFSKFIEPASTIPRGEPADPALQVSPDSVRNRFIPPPSLIR